MSLLQVPRKKQHTCFQSTTTTKYFIPHELKKHRDKTRAKKKRKIKGDKKTKSKKEKRQ
jgi:hypothetical protein